jgi:hypothetical protein
MLADDSYMSSITVVYDCTTANVSNAPAGQLAGYATGAGIAWTAPQWAAHPKAVRIAQSPALGLDEAVHADILDVEARAATTSECGPWAINAMASYNAVLRPGQREPAIYMSAFNVSAVVNALIAAGVHSGVGLWVANWNLTQAQAVQDVLAAAGPFPVIGIQFHNAGPYDVNIFSTTWLGKVSGSVPTPPPPPPLGAYHLSATSHFTVNAAWDVVPGADHYPVTFTPDHGAAVTVEVPQPVKGKVVHLMDMVLPAQHGKLVVNAIVNAKPVLVGTRNL